MFDLNEILDGKSGLVFDIDTAKLFSVIQNEEYSQPLLDADVVGREIQRIL